MNRPQPGEYAPFHQTYISALPPRGAARGLLDRSFRETEKLLKYCTDEQADYAYAEGKWTLKQLVMHLIDAERVFAFRALWFMRADRAPLPGFNQEFWMEQVDVQNRSMKSLLREWKSVRENTIALIDQCSAEQAAFTGNASGWQTSVRAYFYIIAGHHFHHLKIIQTHYLPPADNQNLDKH